jgi:hypothetical protein
MSRKQKSSSIDLQRFWQSSIKKWRKSGLSVRQFCKDQDLSEPSFYFWRRKLIKTGAAEADGQKDKKPSAFIEVSIPDGNLSTLELVLTSGNVLKIGSSVDSRALNNVLSVLREAGLC